MHKEKRFHKASRHSVQKLLLFLHFNVLNEKSRDRGIIHLRNTYMRVLAQKQSFSTGKLVIILLENQQQPREAPIGNEVRTKKAKNKKRNYFFN